jgi:uncharacterized peroxidase-related enzyme
MPYLPPPTDAQAPPAARALYESIQQQVGMVPNIFRTMGYQPEVLEAVLKLNDAIQHELPAKLRELAYMKASQVNQCNYCAHYHKLFGKKAGVSAAQIAALDDDAAGDLFNSQEKAVLRFADQLTRQAKVDKATVDELQTFLSPAQLVVLAATVSLANFTNRFNHALDIELP